MSLSFILNLDVELQRLAGFGIVFRYRDMYLHLFSMRKQEGFGGIDINFFAHLVEELDNFQLLLKVSFVKSCFCSNGNFFHLERHIILMMQLSYLHGNQIWIHAFNNSLQRVCDFRASLAFIRRRQM